MRKKRPSLRVRAELYAAKHAPLGAVKADLISERELAARDWAAGYIQGKRDARKSR